MLFDDDAHPHAVVAREGVGQELDVVDREVVVAALLEVGRDAFALAVEHGDVENPAGPHKGVDRVGSQDLLEELVAEVVGDRIDQVGLALPHAVGDAGAFAARNGVDLERGVRREETLGIHVDLEILGALAREVQVEDDGLFADAAFPLVPLVVLRGIGLLVEPHVEIGAQKALVGGLAHVFL